MNLYVTGAWDIGRGDLPFDNSYDWKRSFEIYEKSLDDLLSTGLNFYVFGDINLQNVVLKHKNAKFIYYPVNEFRQNFKFYQKIEKIRNNPEWKYQKGADWLKGSPQSTLDLFNPVIMSKIYFINKIAKENLDKKVYWVDAGLTRTTDKNLLNEDILENKLNKYNKFLLLRFKYETNTEIHGFKREGMNKFCNTEFVNYVCRAQFFGGNYIHINKALNEFENILEETLIEGYLGTEESILTIMTYKNQENYDLEWIHNGMTCNFFI